jgi:hypothetical protein
MQRNDGIKRVDLGNGMIAEFPESMAWEEIERNLRKQFPVQNTSPNINSEAPPQQMMQQPGQFDRGKQMYAQATGMNAKQPPLFGNVQDFLYGMGKGGENIARLVGGTNTPAMPDIRQANSNPAAVALGQYTPFALAGGGGLLGSTLAAGTYGATQYEPEQKGFIDTQLNKIGIPYGGRGRNIAEDILINGIFHGALKPLDKLFGGNAKNKIPTIDFKNTSKFSPQESEFNNLPFKPPSFLAEKEPQKLSENIANDITNNIMGNRNLEQSGKELASEINHTYQNVKNVHSEKFDKIMNEPVGEPSIFTGEPIFVKDKLMLNSKYREGDFLSESKDQNLNILNKKFEETPSVQNAHALQSELGSEIGYLKKQKENGLLDAEGKNRLNNYVHAQNLLQEDIRSELKDINPKLMEDYDIAREDWRRNVIPYHSDKNLRAIAEGRIKNPESGIINGIFKNPEENINKVANDLNPRAKQRIIHHALGKIKEDLTPEQLLAARKGLDINGMSSYLNPQDEQLFRNLRSNLQIEKERGIQKEINDTFLKGLKNIQKGSESERISAAKKREAGFQEAEKESTRIVKDYNRKINTEFQDKLKAIEEHKRNRQKFIRKLLLGGAAIAGVHELGLNEADVLAAYLTGFTNKMKGKK